MWNVWKCRRGVLSRLRGYQVWGLLGRWWSSRGSSCRGAGQHHCVSWAALQRGISSLKRAEKGAGLFMKRYKEIGCRLNKSGVYLDRKLVRGMIRKYSRKYQYCAFFLLRNSQTGARLNAALSAPWAEVGTFCHRFSRQGMYLHLIKRYRLNRLFAGGKWEDIATSTWQQVVRCCCRDVEAMLLSGDASSAPVPCYCSFSGYRNSEFSCSTSGCRTRQFLSFNIQISFFDDLKLEYPF